MLARFGEKADLAKARPGPDGSWRTARGAGRSPTAAASAIFCSRAAHRLGAATLLAETRRVLRPGGQVVFGSLERSPESVRSALQRRMRELLAEALGQAKDMPGATAGGATASLAAALGAAASGWWRPRSRSRETAGRSPWPAGDRRPASPGWRSRRKCRKRCSDGSQAWAREQYVDLDRPRPAIAALRAADRRPRPGRETAEEQAMTTRLDGELLTALGQALVDGSLTDSALLAQTAGPVGRILPQANVVKIGGQSMMDRGRSAMFPIVEEIVANLGRHQMILGTGAGTRARHAYSVSLDLGLPTGVMSVLGTFVSMQNARMLHYLLAKHGIPFIEPAQFPQLPLYLAERKAAIFSACRPTPSGSRIRWSAACRRTAPTPALTWWPRSSAAAR